VFTIHLTNLQFHSFHGVYEEEKLLGNLYEVNVELMVDGIEPVTRLDQTVNYETVYAITAQRMTIPTPLLETVAQDLANLIYEANPRARSVKVNIEKKYPPVATIQGAVVVSYKKDS
jgi:dihydroneopterin aldolase